MSFFVEAKSFTGLIVQLWNLSKLQGVHTRAQGFLGRAGAWLKSAVVMHNNSYCIGFLRYVWSSRRDARLRVQSSYLMTIGARAERTRGATTQPPSRNKVFARAPLTSVSGFTYTTELCHQSSCRINSPSVIALRCSRVHVISLKQRTVCRWVRARATVQTNLRSNLRSTPRVFGQLILKTLVSSHWSAIASLFRSR